MRRWRVVSTVASTALVVSTLGHFTTEAADAAGPEAAVKEWGPWTGSMSIESTLVSSRNVGNQIVQASTAEYTDVEFGGGPGGQSYRPGLRNTYRAEVDVSAHYESVNACVGGGSQKQWSDWAFSGRSEDAVDQADGRPGYLSGGMVVALDDSDDSTQTFFEPVPVLFTTAMHYEKCPRVKPSPDGRTSGHGASLYGDGNSFIVAADPLVDEDPDPSHLVGKTEWTLGNYPTSSPPQHVLNYATEYSFTVTYDLHREPWNGESVDAVDDGPTTVRYKTGNTAPPRSLDLLANDTGTDLIVDGLSASPGLSVLPSPGDDVVYQPPAPGFVGPVNVDYSIRQGSDPVGTVRDAASWALTYLQCRRHEVRFAGRSNGGDVAWAEGSLRVCSDGSTVTADDSELDVGTTWRAKAVSAFVKTVSHVVSKALRSPVSYDMSMEWKNLSSPGSSTLYGRFESCHKWVLGVDVDLNHRVIKKVTERLTKVAASKRVAEELVESLLSPDIKWSCGTLAGFRVLPPYGGADGYTLVSEFYGNWAGWMHLRKFTIDGWSSRAVSPETQVTTECPFSRDAVDGSLLMSECSTDYQLLG